MIGRLIKRAFRGGVVISGIVTAGMVIVSLAEGKGPFGTLNAISHAVDGDDKVYSDELDLRDTSIGLTINTAAMVAWAGIYDFIFGRVELPNSLAAGALLSATAYVIDYHLVPKQFTPGIEKKISSRGIFATYVVLAIALGLSPIWNRPRATN